MWVHVFGVTSNWILPLSGFRPWFAFAEKVFFVRSQRWLKTGAFCTPIPCAIWIRVNPFVLFWKSFHRELQLDKRVCFLLFPPQFLCQRKFPQRGSVVSSSQSGSISRVVNWPFPLASVHLLETIWKLIQLSDLSIWCRAKTKTLQVDLAFPPLHSLLNFSRFVFLKTSL